MDHKFIAHLMGQKSDGNDDQWQRLINCPACRSPFVTPSQLNCGHMICSQCVEKLVGKDPQSRNELLTFMSAPVRRVECPECSKVTVVPNKGLPVNSRVQEMVKKLAPEVMKRQHMKNCTQCGDVLSKGVFFNCRQCAKTRICSMCAVLLHNGHSLQDRQLIPQEKIMEAKLEVEEARRTAHKAMLLMTPRIQGIGGTVQVRMFSKINQLFPVFEQIKYSLEVGITDETTIADIDKRVANAKKVAEVYTKGAERVDKELWGAIGAVVESFLAPFETTRKEILLPERSADKSATTSPGSSSDVPIRYIPQPVLHRKPKPKVLRQQATRKHLAPLQRAMEIGNKNRQMAEQRREEKIAMRREHDSKTGIKAPDPVSQP